MSVCKRTGSFVFSVKGTDYDIDYTAILYSGLEHRVDYVEVEPSKGEDMPEEIFEANLDAMEKIALDKAHQKDEDDDC